MSKLREAELKQNPQGQRRGRKDMSNTPVFVKMYDGPVIYNVPLLYEPW